MTILECLCISAETGAFSFSPQRGFVVAVQYAAPDRAFAIVSASSGSTELCFERYRNLGRRVVDLVALEEASESRLGRSLRIVPVIIGAGV